MDCSKWFLLLIGGLLLAKFTLKSENFKESYGANCPPLTVNEVPYDQPETQPYNNCYAYAFRDLELNRSGKPQPGFRAGLKPAPKGRYNCNEFIKRIQLDHPDAEYKGQVMTDCEGCKYMVYLVLDVKGSKRDYHFYRQNSDGFWSHKPGSKRVAVVDAAGNKITDPSKAAHKYKEYDYSTPCGFFCVS
jgi:hypothetical protein